MSSVENGCLAVQCRMSTQCTVQCVDSIQCMECTVYSVHPFHADKSMLTATNVQI